MWSVAYSQQQYCDNYGWCQGGIGNIDGTLCKVYELLTTRLYTWNEYIIILNLHSNWKNKKELKEFTCSFSSKNILLSNRSKLQSNLFIFVLQHAYIHTGKALLFACDWENTHENKDIKTLTLVFLMWDKENCEYWLFMYMFLLFNFKIITYYYCHEIKQIQLTKWTQRSHWVSKGL